ncbi:MAG: SUKH-3 domain-containing protein [Bacteroidota bacterium]
MQTEKMSEFNMYSKKVASLIAKSGWYEARVSKGWLQSILEIKFSVPSSHACNFIREFHGLTIEPATLGVDFHPGNIQIDPQLAFGEDDRFAYFSKKVNDDIFPVGEAFGGHQFVGIGSAGYFYVFMDDYIVTKKNENDLFEHILLGLM